MASKTTNNALEALRRRQAAERVALEAASAAGAAVERAREKRTAELVRLDATVGDAERGEDVAVAVLAALVPADVAAELAAVTAARVRLAQQRAAPDEVSARVQELTGGVPVRRRGRPPGGGQPAGPGRARGRAGLVVGGRRSAQEEQGVPEQGHDEQHGGDSDGGGASAGADGKAG